MKKSKIVAINGSFDIIHCAHLKFINFSSNLGDRLVVGINSDSSIKKNKGPTRPINNQKDRAEFLFLLDKVDDVIIFDQTNAVEFLKVVNPDIYCVGGRYNLETMNSEERKYLNQIGAEIKFFPLVEGYSTSKIVDKLNE